MKGVLGFDLSLYQLKMDYRKAKDAGIRAAIIKATEAVPYAGYDAIDPQLRTHYEGLSLAGIKIVAVYHYFRAWCSGQAQAEHFLNVVGPLLDGQVAQVRAMVDVEIKCSLRQVLDFGNEIKKATGQFPILYTNPNTWLYLVQGDRAPFVEWDLMQAQWYVPKPQPLEPWAKAGIAPVIWQFSAKNNLKGAQYGAGAGSSADMDLDWFDEDWLGLPAELSVEERLDRLEAAAKAHGWEV